MLNYWQVDIYLSTWLDRHRGLIIVGHMENMLQAIKRGAAETLAAQKVQSMTKYTDDHTFGPFGKRSMKGMAIHLHSRMRQEDADPSAPEYTPFTTPVQEFAMDTAIEERRRLYTEMGRR